MNPLKIVIPAALVLGGLAVWQFSPSARGKVRNVFEDFGAWTEEARKDDPLGYMDFAIKRLKEDESKFSEAKGSLASAKKKAETRKDEFTTKHENAIELADLLKSTFQGAEAGSGYPVDFRGDSYTRDQLVSQVTLILAERDAYDGAIQAFTTELTRLEEASTGLSARMITIKGNITNLESQRSVLEVQQLTSDIEEIMSQVQELIVENDEEIKTLDDGPVRSLDELFEATDPEKAQDAEPTGGDAALLFLEG